MENTVFNEVEHQTQANETWENETDPARRVELFLEENIQLFVDSHDAWLEVKEYQYRLNELGIQRPNMSRAERRAMQKSFGMTKNPGAIFAIPKSQAKVRYDHINKHVFEDGASYEEKKQQITPYINYNVEKIEKEMENLGTEYSEMISVEKLFTNFSEPYIRAYLARDEILSRLQCLLEDDATTKAFLNRIRSMASGPHSTEEKSFLEIIATQTTQEDQEKGSNFLQEKSYRVAPPPKTYSYEFIEKQVNQEGDEGKGKELNAIVGMIKLVSSIVEDDFGVDPGHIIEKLSQRVELWPQDLQKALQNYHSTKTYELWNSLESLLKPYIREGRLPVGQGKELQVTMTTKNPKERKRTNPATLSLGRKKQDHEAVTEPEELSSFAIVGRRTNKKETYDVDYVESLEELYELSNLADYAEKHSEDQTLEPLFKAALNYLTKNPYDNSCTERLKSFEYTLEGDPRNGERRPRRFKPQSFPGIKKGPIAMSTRIIYDVLRLEGKPTLVIYGAFIKQDIEGFNKLPKR